MSNEKTIIIPKVWFEDLLKYAEKAKKDECTLNLTALFGYINSVKTILKYNK